MVDSPVRVSRRERDWLCGWDMAVKKAEVTERERERKRVDKREGAMEGVPRKLQWAVPD